MIAVMVLVTEMEVVTTLMRALMGGSDSVQRDHREDRVVMGMAAMEGPRGRCLTFFLWKRWTITCFPRALPLTLSGTSILASEG